MPKAELKPTTREEREEWENYLIHQSSYVNCFSARDALRLIADVERLEAQAEDCRKNHIDPREDSDANQD